MIIQEFGKTLIFQGLVVVCFRLLLSGSALAGLIDFTSSSKKLLSGAKGIPAVLDRPSNFERAPSTVASSQFRPSAPPKGVAFTVTYTFPREAAARPRSVTCWPTPIHSLGLEIETARLRRFTDEISTVISK